MGETLFYFVQELVKVYVLLRFAGLFLERRRGRAHLFLGAAYWLVNGALNLALGNGWVNLVTTFVLYGAAVAAGYEGRPWKKTLVVLLGMAAGMACEDMVWLVVGGVPGSGGAHLGNSMSVLLMLAAEAVLQKCVKLEGETGLAGAGFLGLAAVPVCGMAATAALVEGSFADRNLQMAGIGAVAVANMSVFVLYDMTVRAYGERLEKEALARQVAMYGNQLEILKESRRRLSEFRHDMRHHLVVIGGYAKKGMDRELLAYLEEGMEYMEAEGEYAGTGNEEVDCILNHMLGRAAKAGARTEVRVSVPGEAFMPVLDLNIVLSNLMENAVEALEGCGGGMLSVCVKAEKGILYISVYNTYGEVRERDGRLLSGKRGYREKGTGLGSVERTVEKYQGEMDIRQEDGLFKVDVVLFLETQAAGRGPSAAGRRERGGTVLYDEARIGKERQERHKSEEETGRMREEIMRRERKT